MLLIGSSPAFARIVESARRVSSSDTTVLVSGETGTGKEALARVIHAASRRRRAPFVPLDCGSIPEELLEAELFGHESGAFTGVVRERQGRLRRADGGTLYLDGAHNMPRCSQARLLRALENREILPLGAGRPQQVDFRVVAAAPPDLAERVAAGSFREDLYYRLKVVELELPPLRERGKDILALAQSFLEKLGRSYCKPVRRFAPQVLELFNSYRWPGNIRELRNVIEASIATARGETVIESDLPLAIRTAVDGLDGSGPDSVPGCEAKQPGASGVSPERTVTFQEQVSAFQRELVLSALGRSLWNFRSAADDLGLERHQLKYLCAKLNIRRPRV